MRRRVFASTLAASMLFCSGALLGAEPFATADEARAMLERAVAALKDNEADALKAFNDEKNKQFRDRDLYVYCFSMTDGKFTAYQEPFLLGADIRKLKLYGEPMGQQAFDLAHDAPAGSLATIAYKLPKPGTNTPSPKEALQTRVGDQACGVAYFK
ncbi:MAG: chemotaxis protein [Xanthobacteraceae bacterium]|nr:chemotaxis protein [Xanthobacteraceae bacterium]